MGNNSDNIIPKKFFDSIKQIFKSTTRDNANIGNNFSSKLLQSASETNKITGLQMIDPVFAKAHVDGDIHIHDLDSYMISINCLNIDTEEALKRGFNTGYGTINSPKRILSAAQLSCILLQSTQNDMYGGQSHVDFDNAMGHYAKESENEIYNKYLNAFEIYWPNKSFDNNKVYGIAKLELENVIKQAMQSVVHNLCSMHSRAGSQVPFSSVNIGLPKDEYAAMCCEIFLDQYNKGLGKGEQAVFPNIIFRVKDGVNKKNGDPYYYLYKKACKVAANRMNPTFLNIDAPYNLKYYNKGVEPCTMGCRTSVMSNINGEPSPKSRGNIAPVTINLVRLAIKASQQCKDVESTYTLFIELLKEKLQFAKLQLLERYDYLKKLKGKDFPFICGQKLILGSEEVGEDDSIEPILKHGTWGIGFIGLAEVMKIIYGKHHGMYDDKIDLQAQSYNVVKTIRDYCDSETQKHKLNFACYATPAEGLSDRFTNLDKEKYGDIDWVTTKGYYTNSYHVPVDYSISILDKLKIEAPFHELCNGGHITYVELDSNPTGEDVENILSTAMSNDINIGYIGINFGIRYCKNCGCNHIKGSVCPECNNADIQCLHRVTGYLSLDERFGPGKTNERNDRITHKK